MRQLQMPRIESVKHETGLGALRPDQQCGTRLCLSVCFCLSGTGGQGINIARLDLVLRIAPKQLQRRRRALSTADKDIACPKAGEVPILV